MRAKLSKQLTLWRHLYPKTTQWLWFVGLWLFGLLSVLTITYPIKLLAKNLR